MANIAKKTRKEKTQKDTTDIRRDIVSRFGDLSDELFSLIGTENEIRISVVPQYKGITFIHDGSGSEHTRKALIDLFYAMREDNEEHPQKTQYTANTSREQFRMEDDASGQLQIIHEKTLIKLITILGETKNYISFSLHGSESRHTCAALLELFHAMKEDDKKNSGPQKL